jgi:hypothetical protein
MIIQATGKPATPKQQQLIEKLVANNFENVDTSYYSGMAVSDLIEAMEEAYRRIGLIKSTELGRALL